MSMMAMKKPAVKVIYDGQTLIENTSYTLTYADNKNAGTASVTIKGKIVCMDKLWNTSPSKRQIRMHRRD